MFSAEAPQGSVRVGAGEGFSLYISSAYVGAMEGLSLCICSGVWLCAWLLSVVVRARGAVGEGAGHQVACGGAVVKGRHAWPSHACQPADASPSSLVSKR